MNPAQKQRPRWAIPTLTILGFAWLVLGTTGLLANLLDQPEITVSWTTESEFDTAGFNVYRSQSEQGEYLKVNGKLIPSQGDTTSGSEYNFIDGNVRHGANYYYRLEDVELDGSTVLHDPIVSRAPSRPLLMMSAAVAAMLVGIYLLALGLKRR